jgi:hypothetical protein
MAGIIATFSAENVVRFRLWNPIGSSASTD